ncbi:MAG: hypothetical protein A3E87_10865 [Gammaproteobacteria bacterium RIFCSPHIGHO2_12_FULL_35_23]|nr:MAG: hypothetical protein A3E87_10865 [Gammaproteobacteria bacterium RIFCSPHIGHO2_12_FULL_35_23]
MTDICSFNLTKQSMLTRNQSIFASAIDDELVMMDGDQGLYFGLNSVARKIWEILEKPTSYAELLSLLTSFYEVKFEQCQKELEPFLLKMIKHKLILVFHE